MDYEVETTALVRAVLSLSAARTLDDIAKCVRSAARKIGQSDGATFVLRENGFCFYLDEDAIGPLWKGQRFPMSACISGWAMIHKKAVIIEDIYQDQRVPVDAYRPTFVKSMAMIPIRKASPIGAIGIYWKDHFRPSEKQLELLQALADTTSVALENVNLYSHLQERIQELKEVNRAKNEFLAALSHEMRTPLNSILGWSEILEEEFQEFPELQDGVNAIRRNALLQSHVIEELLDVSQLVSGKMEFQSAHICINKAVDKAILDCQKEAFNKGIHIHLKNSRDLFVHGDFNRVVQIIKELIKNAIKFSPHDGEIIVEISKAGPNVVVQVTDKGVGIEDQLISKVFDIFWQQDGSNTRKYGGLGLGLAIVQRLAKAHHGSIKAHSLGADQGSTFTFLIPDAVSTEKIQLDQVSI